MPKGYILTKDGYVEAGLVVKPEEQPVVEQPVVEKKEEVKEKEIHTGRHRSRR